MQYHDFHLAGYQVRHTDSGREIVLDLVYDYPLRARVESRVRFNEVAIYHFSDVGSAIITDIDEVPLATLLERSWPMLQTWAVREGGLAYWDRDDAATYQRKLEIARLRAWEIAAAIGFSGFVIARSIENTVVE